MRDKFLAVVLSAAIVFASAPGGFCLAATVESPAAPSSLAAFPFEQASMEDARVLSHSSYMSPSAIAILSADEISVPVLKAIKPIMESRAIGASLAATYLAGLGAANVFAESLHHRLQEGQWSATHLAAMEEREKELQALSDIYGSDSVGQTLLLLREKMQAVRSLPVLKNAAPDFDGEGVKPGLSPKTTFFDPLRYPKASEKRIYLSLKKSRADKEQNKQAVARALQDAGIQNSVPMHSNKANPEYHAFLDAKSLAQAVEWAKSLAAQDAIGAVALHPQAQSLLPQEPQQLEAPIQTAAEEIKTEPSFPLPEIKGGWINEPRLMKIQFKNDVLAETAEQQIKEAGLTIHHRQFDYAPHQWLPAWAVLAENAEAAIQNAQRIIRAAVGQIVSITLNDSVAIELKKVLAVRDDLVPQNPRPRKIFPLQLQQAGREEAIISVTFNLDAMRQDPAAAERINALIRPTVITRPSESRVTLWVDAGNIQSAVEKVRSLARENAILRIEACPSVLSQVILEAGHAEAQTAPAVASMPQSGAAARKSVLDKISVIGADLHRIGSYHGDKHIWIEPRDNVSVDEVIALIESVQGENELTASPWRDGHANIIWKFRLLGGPSLEQIAQKAGLLAAAEIVARVEVEQAVYDAVKRLSQEDLPAPGPVPAANPSDAAVPPKISRLPDGPSSSPGKILLKVKAGLDTTQVIPAALKAAGITGVVPLYPRSGDGGSASIRLGNNPEQAAKKAVALAEQEAISAVLVGPEAFSLVQEWHKLLGKIKADAALDNKENQLAVVFQGEVPEEAMRAVWGHSHVWEQQPGKLTFPGLSDLSVVEKLAETLVRRAEVMELIMSAPAAAAVKRTLLGHFEIAKPEAALPENAAANQIFIPQLFGRKAEKTNFAGLKEFLLALFAQGEKRDVSARIAAAELMGEIAGPEDVEWARGILSADISASEQFSRHYPEVGAAALILGRYGNQTEDRALILRMMDTSEAFSGHAHNPAKEILKDALVLSLTSRNKAQFDELVDNYLHKGAEWKNHPLMREAMFRAVARQMDSRWGRELAPETRAQVREKLLKDGAEEISEARLRALYDYLKQADKDYLQKLYSKWRENELPLVSHDRDTALTLYATADFSAPEDAAHNLQALLELSEGTSMMTNIRGKAIGRLATRFHLYPSIQKKIQDDLQAGYGNNSVRALIVIQAAAAASVEEKDEQSLENIFGRDPERVQGYNEVVQREAAVAWAKMVVRTGRIEQYLAKNEKDEEGQPISRIEKMLTDANPIVNKAALEALKLQSQLARALQRNRS